MKTFDAKEVKNQVVQWIRDWFEVNGKGCNAVIGISGGKDSSTVAALCVEALGRDRVIGVTMPNGVQKDISDSMMLINHLGIRHFNVNIADTYNALMNTIGEQLAPEGIEISRQTVINMPPRLRMTTLYAISQSMNGRVANTCNLSEDWVGYSTRYGDAAGDFAPLGGLTVAEVKAIGRAHASYVQPRSFAAAMSRGESASITSVASSGSPPNQVMVSPRAPEASSMRPTKPTTSSCTSGDIFPLPRVAKQYGHSKLQAKVGQMVTCTLLLGGVAESSLLLAV